MGMNLRAVALLGLLDLDDIGLRAPTGVPETVEHQGHWRIEHYSDLFRIPQADPPASRPRSSLRGLPQRAGFLLQSCGTLARLA